ncbi:MAG: T9SS type A sorting domain-containing protein [Bacteroidota bacterium]
MKDHVVQRAIKILPDLTDKHYTIFSQEKELSNSLQVDLLNSGGKQLENKIIFWQVNAHAYHIDLTSLPAGVYHLRVMDEDTYFVKRIILQ